MTPRSEASTKRQLGSRCPGPSRLVARVLTVSFMTLLGVIALPNAAHAHTDLVSSVPAAGETVSGVPAQVRLVFNEAVEKDFANFTVAIGGRKPLILRPTVNGAVATASVPRTYRSMVTQGSRRWRLAYRVVSGDGHPVTGSFTFTVKAPSSASATPSTTPPDDLAAEPETRADAAHGSEDSVSSAGESSEPGVSAWAPTAIIATITIVLSGVVMVRVARGRHGDKRA